MVLKRVKEQEQQQRLQTECMVAQNKTIQRLQEQRNTIQFDHQANGASSVEGSIPRRIPASISTGITQESLEAMFKTWTTTQAAKAPGTEGLTSKEKEKRKWRPHYIENDLQNDECTKR